MSKLTEVDMLLAEINKIIDEFDDKKSDRIRSEEKTDPIQAIKRNMEILIQDIDTLLDEREKILSSVGNVDVAKKYKNQNAIETKLNSFQGELSNFNQEISSMKKNKSKNKNNYNIEKLEEIMINFRDQYKHMQGMFSGEILEKKKPTAINDIKNLDEELEKRKNAGPEREMYQEEKDKIQNWNGEIKKQDEKLQNFQSGIKQMKINVKEIGRSIDLVGKNVEKTNRMAEKTEKNLEKSNKTLKDILEKVGGATNFCVDVVLVCVCLGLIAVLYNLIKNQMNKPATQTNTTTRMLFLS